MGDPRVHSVLVSLIFVRPVLECLSPPFGRMVTLPGYRAAFDGKVIGSSNLRLPWDTGRCAKWNHFWSRYLGKPKNARTLSADTAWDYIVPLAWDHQRTFAGPPGATIDLEAWLYPHASVVLGTLEIQGSWTLAQLPEAVAAIRHAKTYGAGAPANRSLDGLATDLADEAARLLVPNEVTMTEREADSPVSIAAPVAGEGTEMDFGVGRPPVDRCISGLASMGPAGTPLVDHFFAPNSDTNLGARVYWGSTGHVIWRAKGIVATTTDEGVSCLQRNHTHALAQVAALGSIVTWADNRLYTVPIDTGVHQLLSRSLFRLDRLGTGDRASTYRSEIVAKRVEPFRASISNIREETGLGYAP